MATNRGLTTSVIFRLFTDEWMNVRCARVISHSPQVEHGRMLLGLHIPTLRSLEHEANTDPLLLTWRKKKVVPFSPMLKIWIL